jgi:hypothetical protein
MYKRIVNKIKIKMSSINVMSISEQLLNNMCSIIQEVAIKAVRECGSKYGFDGEVAIRELGLETVKVSRKSSTKLSKSKVVVVKEKARFALPFNGECSENNCQALRQNNGLYTQCQFARKGDKSYCKPCQQLADKSEDGVPEYGTIMQRLSVDIFEYVDPKGRKPVSYTKVMKKYKLTEEQVLEEAGRLNITINPGHFVAPVQETKRGRPASAKEAKEPKGSKGRPKKAKKVLEIEGDEDDLFASLVADANSEEEEVEEEVEVEVKDTKALEKEAKRLEKEAKLAAEKAEKEAKLAAEKAEKEAKLAAKELEKKQKEEQRLKEKAEKEAKLAADKAEKEAKLAADKAEKEAKLAADKAEKEAKLAADKEAKLAADKGGKKKKAVVEVEEEDEPDVVKKIEFEGKKYLKSKKTGIIYDYTEYVKNGDQVVVGKWNESKNKIDFTETSEESEEEYEE